MKFTATCTVHDGKAKFDQQKKLEHFIINSLSATLIRSQLVATIELCREKVCWPQTFQYEHCRIGRNIQMSAADKLRCDKCSKFIEQYM